ncbi:MAG: hypothetical protein ACE5IO_05625 [Thermoplasmata archaeon]
MKNLLIGFVFVTVLASSLALASTSILPQTDSTEVTETTGITETTGTTGITGTTDTSVTSGEDSVVITLPDTPTPTVVVTAERSQKTKGATTIEWDSSFQDPDYTLGDVLSITVTWDVLSGYAEYDSFDLKGKGFTPVPKKDPATGELVTVVQSGNSVSFDIRFDELHWDEVRQVDIGNAHLKLYLMVDEDGDGSAELLAGFGVNIHVEDPA